MIAVPGTVRRGVWRCAIAALLFGISAPAASELAGELGSFKLAGLLYLGAALAVTPVAGRVRPTRSGARAALPRLSMAVVLGGAAGPVLFAAGLRHAPAATASLLLNLELVFTALLAAFVFREHVGRRVSTGVALVVVAGGVLGWSGDPGLRWGAVLIAGACLCWAIDNCVTANLDQLAPAQITLAKGVIAGGANLLIGISLSEPSSWAPVVWALVVGGFGYGVSITLWVAGARDLGAARGQLVFATAPFVGAVVAWTAFGGAVTVREAVSLVIAAAGVSVVIGSGHEHEHRHDAVEHDHEHTHGDGHHDHRDAAGTPARHQHPHVHQPVTHSHPHVPDLHHHHEHPG